MLRTGGAFAAGADWTACCLWDDRSIRYIPVPDTGVRRWFRSDYPDDDNDSASNHPCPYHHGHRWADDDDSHDSYD